MIDIKKFLLIVVGLSVILSLIGFVISKMSPISGLLAGGALAGVLGGIISGGGGGGLGGGLGWDKNKNNKKPKKKQKPRKGFTLFSRGGKRLRKRKRFF